MKITQLVGRIPYYAGAAATGSAGGPARCSMIAIVEANTGRSMKKLIMVQ